MNNIKDTIVEKIKAGEVAMRPRWRFMLETTLFAVGAVLSALVAVYLASFVLFALKESGLWFAPGLGMRGFTFFLLGSPWLLISVFLLFLFILYLLVTHFSFSYRRPLLYSIMGVVLLVAVTASCIQQTMFHKRVQTYLEAHPMPGVSSFYERHSKGRPDGIVFGEVIRLENPDFVMETDKTETYVVRVTPETVLSIRGPLVVGDTVLVFGDLDDDSVVAFGVRRAPPGFIMPPKKTLIERIEGELFEDE
jgi:hypothetical protein